MFVDGVLPADEQARVAAHLAECPSCRAALADARDLSAALRDAAQSPASPEEPCPTAWTLVQYSDNALDEETARHVRAHLFWCEDCLAEVLALEQEREEQLPLQEALIQYLARWRATRTAAPLAAEGEAALTMPAQVHGPAGTPEHLTLEVLFGPTVSPEGRFSLDLQVPEAPWCEGREVRVTLHLDPYTFDMPSRVERATITLNYSLPGDYQGAAPELREALLQALEVHIL